MDPATPLLRQVNPHWMKDGHVLSIAFRPFPKDLGLLSVYDGDLIAPSDAWSHFTAVLGLASAGVWSVSVAEVEECGLVSRPDPLPDFHHHAVIDFTGRAEKEQKLASKILAAKAEARGCLFSPP